MSLGDPTEPPTPPTYVGEELSLERLEEWITGERALQTRRVGELETIREQNEQLHVALTEELEKLRTLSEEHRPEPDGLFTRLLARLRPGAAKFRTTHSVESLLRQQYELSVRRLREAADHADRLEAAEADLHDEVDRLNQRIVDSVDNRGRAAGYLGELRQMLTGLTPLADASALDVARAEAMTDRVKRLLLHHGTRHRLFSTADERLGRLRDNGRTLAGTIAALRADIATYVEIAGEKLDMTAGQVQALGAAADASVVVLELEASLSSLSESMNDAARFVADTQVYVRENIDVMVEEMRVYDDETAALLEANAEMERLDDQYVLSQILSELDSVSELEEFERKLEQVTEEPVG